MSRVDELIPRVALFKGLGSAVHGDIARQMREHNYGSGQLIFQRGESAADLFLIAKGRVRISITSTEGRELSFSFFHPGEIFGEIAALDGAPRTADATCVTAVTAYLLSRAALTSLLQTSPEFAKALVGLLCARLRDVDLQLESIALHRIETRLARYVLGRISELPSRAGGATPATLRIGLSQGDLALLLGASRPRVNAAFMLLEERGALVKQGEHFTFDTGALETIAELT